MTLQQYHNKLDTVRNGKVIFPAGKYYLVSEVDAWQETHLKGYRAAMNEKDEQIATLKEALKNIMQRANESGPGEMKLIDTIHAMHRIARAAIGKEAGK